MTHSQLAEALFAAFESGDADAAKALCAPALRGSQNGGPSFGLEAVIGFALKVKSIAPDFGYKDAVRSDTATGFVEEHRICATLPDGTAFDMMICVVGEVKGGKVVALREYLDTAAAEPLTRALVKALAG